jgi:hypothetical protein
MRSCEFCSAAVDDASNKCTGCGAAQSTPAPAAAAAPVAAPAAVAPGPVTPAQAVQSAVTNDKPKGSWGCLIGLVCLFWPAAIWYYLTRRW